MHIQLGTVDASDPPDTLRYLNPLHGVALPPHMCGSPSTNPPPRVFPLEHAMADDPVVSTMMKPEVVAAYEKAGAASGLPPAEDVWASLRDAVKGVKLSSKKRRLKTVPNCFSGREAVDWFLARFPKLARAHGQLIMQQLCDRGLLLNATGKGASLAVGQFEDADNCLLRFKVVNDSAGHLTVTVKEAAGLMEKQGEMYCNLDVKYKKSEVSLTTNNWKTQLCKGPVPKWNATFKAPSRVLPQQLQLELSVFSKHAVGSNSFLGQLEIPLDPLTGGDLLEDWFPLQMRRQGEEVRGEVLLSLSFTGINDEDQSASRSASVAALMAAAAEDEMVRDEGFVDVEDPMDMLAEIPYEFDQGGLGGELITERNAAMGGGMEYKSATLIKLVELLSSADIPAGSTIVDDVLCTYPTFTNAIKLLNLFLKRYIGPPPNVDQKLIDHFEKHRKDVQNRVGSFLARWMTSTSDWSDNAKLFSYFRKLIDMSFFDPTPSLAKYFAKKYDECKKRRLGLDGPVGGPPSGILDRLGGVSGSGGNSPTLRAKRTGSLRGGLDMLAVHQVPLLDLNAEEIAEQITLIEHDLFRAIDPIELLNQNWNKHPEISPHVMEYIQWFNKMCQWAGTEIIKEDNPESRAVIIAKFIRIADRLAQLNNFNGLMEVLASLEGSAIRRLKLSWAELPQADADKLEELAALMKPEKNFKDYRARIVAATGKPWIPYLGLHLTDLTFVDDGNSTWMDNGSSVVNLQKSVMSAQCVRTVLDSAKIDYYGIRPMNSIQKLLVNVSNSVFDDNEIYRLSLLREARNAGGDAADRGRGNRNRLANIAKSMMKRANVAAEKELTDADWSLVLEGARTVLVKKDHVIIQQGQPNSKMYMIQTGGVRVEKKTDDQSEPIVLAIMEPPKVFGEMSIIMPDNKPAVSCVANMEGMKLYETNSAELHKAFAVHPDLARRFYMTMAKKLSDMLVALVPPKKDSKDKDAAAAAAAAADDTEDDSAAGGSTGGTRKKKKKKKPASSSSGGDSLAPKTPRESGSGDGARRRKPKRRDSAASSRRTSAATAESVILPPNAGAEAPLASVGSAGADSGSLPPPPTEEAVLATDAKFLPSPPSPSVLPPPVSSTSLGTNLPKHAPPPPPPGDASVVPAIALATALEPMEELQVKKVTRKKKVVRRKKRPTTARKEENVEDDALRYGKAFGMGDEKYLGKYDATFKRYAGKLVLFEKHVCFLSEMFMTTTKRIYPLARIRQVDRRSDGICMCTLSTDIVLAVARELADPVYEAVAKAWEKVEKDSTVDMDDEGVAQDASTMAAEDLYELSQKSILTPTDWELMLGGAKKVTFQEGEFIIRAGETYQKIYHIVRGSCNVEINRGGEAVIINRMQENTTFGEMSFILQSEDSEYQASASVIAAEEVEISIIEGYFLNIIFDMHPGKFQIFETRRHTSSTHSRFSFFNIGLVARFFEYLCNVLANRIHKQTMKLRG